MRKPLIVPEWDHETFHCECENGLLSETLQSKNLHRKTYKEIPYRANPYKAKPYSMELIKRTDSSLCARKRVYHCMYTLCVCVCVYV